MEKDQCPSWIRAIVGIAGACAFLLIASVPALAGHPFPVQLKGYDAGGKVVDISPAENSAVPYSPKQTCGTCHPYDEITRGYHFQQGMDQGSDNYGVAHGQPAFISSPGMFGKW